MPPIGEYLRKSALRCRRLVAECKAELWRKILSMALDMEITAIAEDLEEARASLTLETGERDAQGRARAIARAALARYLEHVRPSKPHLFTVLFVDDDSDVCRVIVQMLAERGFTVLGAQDAHAALRMLSERPVDLLFADIAMPEIDGVELAKRAKVLRPGIKVLFITGYPTKAAERCATDYGKLLIKPLRQTALLREVEAALCA